MEKVELSSYIENLTKELINNLKNGVVWGAIKVEVEVESTKEAKGEIKYFVVLGGAISDTSKTKITLNVVPKISDDDFSYLAKLKNTRLI